MGVIIAWAVTLHAGAEDSRCVVTPYLIGKVRLALFAQQEKLMSLEKCLRFARSFSERFRDRLAAAYLFSSAGQLSNKLIEVDSARAGVTATNRWPSAVTSNKGAATSKRFIWKRVRMDFTCKDCDVKFNSAFISWLPVLKK